MRELLLALAAALTGAVTGTERLTDIDVPQATHDVPGAFDEATDALTARLNDLHPAGSPAADLRAALDAQGFAAEAPGVARLEEDGFLCTIVWIVTWSEAGGRVTSIRGEQGGICL